MPKLLSIRIPTYNRAEQLDQQLAWLAQEIEGFENDCDVTVFDNCSTDNTQEVLSKWQHILDGTDFQAVRNSRNIGCMPNIARCLNHATGQYVWAIGDDDQLNRGTLAFVLQTLKERSDLALMYLNFSDVSKTTGQTIWQHWFDTDLEPYACDGKAVFQRCLQRGIGSVIFLSATIYRTDFVKSALRLWPNSVKNWAGQAYWTAFCATQGSVLVTKDNYLICLISASHWEKEHKIFTRIPSKDIPELCLKIQGLGYPHDFCRQVILHNLKDYINLNKWKGYLRLARDWPLATASALVFVAGSLCTTATEAIGPKESSENLRRDSEISCVDSECID